MLNKERLQIVSRRICNFKGSSSPNMRMNNNDKRRDGNKLLFPGGEG